MGKINKSRRRRRAENFFEQGNFSARAPRRNDYSLCVNHDMVFIFIPAMNIIMIYHLKFENQKYLHK